MENAVGFLRRNLMVPIPAAQSLNGLSRALLARCDELLDKDITRKQVAIKELFATDIAACKAVPRIGFDACTWETRTVDLVGNIMIGQVRYLLGSEHAHSRVHVGIHPNTIEILDGNGATIIEHQRCYSQQAETVIDPVTLLSSLTRRPGTLRNSAIRTYLPQTLLDYLDQADSSEQRRIWRIMGKACQYADFATVASTITTVIEADRPIDEAATIMPVKLETSPHQALSSTYLATTVS